MAAIEAHGWTQSGTYRDGTSASRFGTKIRGEWGQLKTDLAAGLFDVMVIWEGSRGSRDAAEWLNLLETCRATDVRIHVVSHDRTYNVHNARDWRALAEDAVDAHYETEKTSTRVRRGLAIAAAEGKPNARAPYGYRRVYDHRGRYEDQVPDDNADTVREIFEGIARRDPIVAVVRGLMRQGIPSPGAEQCRRRDEPCDHPSNHPWDPASIRKIIRNHAYAGRRVHRSTRIDDSGRLVPFEDIHEGLWQGLVTEDRWSAANAVLDAPGRKRAKPGKAAHLLSYIMSAPCAAGASRMSYLPRAAHGGRARYSCTFDGCTSVEADMADAVVIAVVWARLAMPDARALLIPDDETTAAARDEVERYTFRLAKAQAEFDAELIEAVDLKRLRDRFRPELAAAQARVQASSANVAALELLDAAQYGKDHLGPAWERLSVAARRDVVRALVSVSLSPATVKLTRSANDGARLAQAKARLSIAPVQRHRS
jgi:DNA invertase Pin-like site-specific DNA recombinase